MLVPAVDALIVEGDHVPVKPSLETSGNTSTFPVTQYGPSCVNVGVVNVFTSVVAEMEIVLVHEPSAMLDRSIVVFETTPETVIVALPPVKTTELDPEPVL